MDESVSIEKRHTDILEDEEENASVSESRIDSYRLYFLSKDKSLTELNPDLNTASGKDSKTKRVSFFPSINQALMSMNTNLRGQEFYVYTPYNIDYNKAKKPYTNQVPEVNTTGEVWFTEKVRIKCIGKIYVIKNSKVSHLVLNPNGDTSNLYDWEYRVLFDEAGAMYDYYSDKEEIIDETAFPLLEEAKYSEENKYPVFIILQHTGANIISKGVKLLKGAEYTHVAISFTPTLDPMYTFGIKSGATYEPLDNTKSTGFVIDSPQGQYWQTHPQCTYGIFVMYIDQKAFDAMNKTLLYFVRHGDEQRYDFVSLIPAYFNISTERSSKYFCSKFVARIIDSGYRLNKVASLWQPNDFQYLENVTCVNKGVDFTKYDASITERNLEYIKANRHDLVKLPRVQTQKKKKIVKKKKPVHHRNMRLATAVEGVELEIPDTTYSFEESEILTEEAVYSEENNCPVFIVLNHFDGNVLSWSTRRTTGAVYSHAAISFTPTLDPMYSFGLRDKDVHEHKPLDLKPIVKSGFIVTSPHGRYFAMKRHASVEYAVYVMYVSQDALNAMQNAVDEFIRKDREDKFKYDFGALALVPFKIPTEKSKRYFCSKFTASILSAGYKLNKANSLWLPDDFRTDLDNITCVNKGVNFDNYDPSITLKNLEYVKSKQYNKIKFNTIYTEAVDDLDLPIGEISKPEVQEVLDNTDPSRIFLSSDWHFFKSYYKKEAQLVNTEKILKWCRENIKSNDVFIYLGDISFRYASVDHQYKSQQFMNSIPGIKILILGNHDMMLGQEYYANCGFDYVYESLVWHNIIFTHKAVNMDFQPSNMLNIHGHIHNLKTYNTTDGHANVNVFPMFYDQKPVTLKYILDHREELTKNNKWNPNYGYGEAMLMPSALMNISESNEENVNESTIQAYRYKAIQEMINVKQQKPTVYFSQSIDSYTIAYLASLFGDRLGNRTAIKLHFGEPGNKNFLNPKLLKDLIKNTNAALVDSNTAFNGSKRRTTEDHLNTAREHGFGSLGFIDILDADGEIPVGIPQRFKIQNELRELQNGKPAYQSILTNGTHLQQINLGSHITNYDSLIVYTHFKGHDIAGFGGAIKNIGMGIPSGKSGKMQIHGANWEKGHLFLERLVESAAAIDSLFHGHIIYINILKNLSSRCDCEVHAPKATISDIGVLVSDDLLAIEQASLDFIRLSNGNKDLMQTIASRGGYHQIEYADWLGLGSRQYTLRDINNTTLKLENAVDEACKDLATARKFVWDVGKLAKKYNANYFIVTDGASGTSNGNGGVSNPAVRNARLAQIEWEKNNGGDPDEDWSDTMKESTLDQKNNDSQKDSINNHLKVFNGYTWKDVQKFYDSIPKGDAEYGHKHKDFSTTIYRNLIDGKGFIEIYLVEDVPNTGAVAIVLHPDARGQGLGTKLVKKAQADMSKMKIDRLEWYCKRTNAASKALAEKCGFKVEEKLCTKTDWVLSYGKAAVNESKYDPPYNKDQVLHIYGKDIYEKLANDPAHAWRMDTGIELIHQEPSLSELERIYANWQLMDTRQKALSDKKSIELFGKNNEDHYKELLPMYENLLFSTKDVTYKKREFENGSTNLAFALGFSGSGKTTIGKYYAKKYQNCDHIELDDVISNWKFSDKEIAEYSDLLKAFFSGIGSKYRISYEELNTSGIPEEEYEIPMTRDIINFAIQYANNHKNKRYILEGVWPLVYGVKPYVLKDCAVFIKGTSHFVSNFRSAIRDSADADNFFKRIFYAVRQFILAYKPSMYKIFALELNKTMNEYIKYFNSTTTGIVREGFYNNDEDLYYNKSLLDNEECNILFLTGLGGSGKTTMASNMSGGKYIHIEMDRLIYNYRYSDMDLYSIQVFKDFFNSIGKKYRMTSKNQLDGFDRNKYMSDIANDFIDFIIPYARKNKKYVFIVEGVYLFFFIDPKKILKYPVYIKGTSAVESIKRASERDTQEAIKTRNLNTKEANEFRQKRYSQIQAHMADNSKKLDTFRSYFKEQAIEETKRSELPDSAFGIPEDRKYPLDTEQHVRSAIRLFGHAEEGKKKSLAHRIASAAKKYDIKIPETTQCYKYLHEESYNDCIVNEKDCIIVIRDYNPGMIGINQADDTSVPVQDTTPNMWSVDVSDIHHWYVCPVRNPSDIDLECYHPTLSDACIHEIERLSQGDAFKDSLSISEYVFIADQSINPIINHIHTTDEDFHLICVGRVSLFEAGGYEWDIKYPVKCDQGRVLHPMKEWSMASSNPVVGISKPYLIQTTDDKLHFALDIESDKCINTSPEGILELSYMGNTPVKAVYEFIGNQGYIDRLNQAYKESTPVENLYTALTGKRMLSEDQIELDPAFKKIDLDLVLQKILSEMVTLRDSILEANYGKPFRRPVVKDFTFRTKPEFLDKYSECKDIIIKEDIDGVYFYSTLTHKRSCSVASTAFLTENMFKSIF